MDVNSRNANIVGDEVLEISPIGITLVNSLGQIIYANNKAEEILGLTKDTITQLTYNAPHWKITDFEGNPFPDEKLPFSLVMKSGQAVYNIQHAIEWDDGRKVFLLINATPSKNDHGDINGIIATIEDITEQVIAKGLLQREKGLLDVLGEINKTGGWEYTTETGEMYWTSQLYEIHEIPVDSGIDHIAESLKCYLPEDRDRIYQAFQKCVTDGVAYDMEVPFVTYKKNERWIRTRTKPIVENGRVVKIIGSVRDITDRKINEEELRIAKDKAEETEKKLWATYDNMLEGFQI